MGTVPKATLAHTLTSANGVRENTTANYALDLKPSQKEVPTTPPATSANLLHQQNTFSITTPIQVHTLANYLENYDPFLANYLIQCSPFASESHIKGHAILYCPTISLPSRVRSIKSLNNCYITALLAL